ncbi:hypothetical protein CDIK_4154 [Cucumispora dikerogammari]|nr:hypothetical protein CDIK_4154 [Cucumispora dikerogammari]
MCAKTQEEFGINLSKSSVDRILSGFQYSLKRIHYIPERRNNSGVIETRKVYALDYVALQGQFSEDLFVFIDEVGLNVSMRATRGRSSVGSAATLVIPSLRSRNVSICCAMNRNGILYYQSHTTSFNTEFFGNFIDNLSVKL